jgi:hypothetical protein
MSSVDDLLNEEHEEFKEFMKEKGIDIEERQSDIFAKGVYQVGFMSWLRARNLSWLYQHYLMSDHVKLVEV